MMRFNNKLKKAYLYTVGIFWISFLIYFRFIRTRSGYELVEAKANLTDISIYINIAFILLHLYLIALAIYLIIKSKKVDIKPNRFLEKISRMFTILILKPLESIRDLIAPYLPGSGYVFCKFAEFIEKNDAFRAKMFVVFFNFVPRIVIASVFFIELIFYHRLKYFLLCIFLFIIPLGWTLFINLFTNFAERGLQDIQNNVKVIGIGEPLSNGWYVRYKFQPLPQFTYQEGELKEWADFWTLMLKIYGYGETYFKEFKRKIAPYFLIITSSLYLFASIYRLSFLLF